MQPGAVTHARLDGVAEGMAEIEDGPETRFTLILADHKGLDLAAALNSMRQRYAVSSTQGIDVGFDPAEKIHVGNRAVFDDLCQPGTEFARRQSFEQVKVANHALRLVKSADHVFTQRVVDRRLTTHRRIDLRQQRRWNLHKRHAAHIAGRGKAGHVAHHTAAQSKQHGLAVAAVLQQCVKNQLQSGPVLVRLAIGQGHQQHLGISAGQRRLQTRGIKRRHLGVGDDQRSAGTRQTRVAVGTAQQICTDQDVIGTICQLDTHLSGRRWSGHLVGFLRHVGKCSQHQLGGRRRGRGRGRLELERLHDAGDQTGHRGAAGFNHQVRRFTVKRVTQHIQLFEAQQGVGHLQQRAVEVMA